MGAIPRRACTSLVKRRARDHVTAPVVTAGALGGAASFGPAEHGFNRHKLVLIGLEAPPRHSVQRAALCPSRVVGCGEALGARDVRHGITWAARAEIATRGPNTLSREDTVVDRVGERDKAAWGAPRCRDALPPARS